MDDIRDTFAILRTENWARGARYDVAEYYRMASAGAFAEHPRVELIEGEIVEMAPIGGRHIGTVMALTQLFVVAAADRFKVSIQNPLRLDDYSEPEPDFVLLRPCADKYRSDEPPFASDAVLVIEVADSSLPYDQRVKMPLYAAHRVTEFWLVDLQEASITICRSPTQDGYADIKTYRGNEQIEPLALPGVLINVADLLAN
jgi:Uma2 family endonuclease